MMHLHRRIATNITVVALAWSIGACAPKTSEWSPIESPKENRVSLVNLTHDVRFAPGQDRLAPEEEARLRAFIVRDSVGYGDRVVIPAVRLPSPTATQLAERQRATVAGYLRRQGLNVARLDPGSVPSDTGTGNRVTVRVARHVVATPACPDWSKDSRDDHTNSTASNWGCASVSNLGLMVADPGDLLMGRLPGPADGEAATLSIQKYRAGRVTPLLSDKGLEPFAAASSPQAPSTGAAR